MLKGALHCHTTRSDGKVELDEVVRVHAANGYDFMAITDHRLYNHKNFAPDVKMLIVPGAECDSNIFGDGGGHCFHSVCIGPSEADGNGYGQDHKFENGKSSDQYAYQLLLDEYHANKNMTIYCHPEWSRTPARAFEKLRGNFAMEIWNSGCALDCEMDNNAAYWDELLMQGIKIFGVATDDGHDAYQHCNGWVMVNAKPELNDILSALARGSFYSSCGPEIYDFYIEDKKAHVECSPCETISFIYGRIPNRVARGKQGTITRAELAVDDDFKYLRASVRDAGGRRAWTNPIFIK